MSNIAKIKAEAKKYLDTPKGERRAKKLFDKLTPDAQHEVRKELETARGFRKINGKIEFTTVELKNQIARLKAKKQDYLERVPVIDERIADLEDELESRPDKEVEVPGATSVTSKRGRPSKRS